MFQVIQMKYMYT